MTDGWTELKVAAAMYHDAQKHRIALTNRAERAPVNAEEYSPALSTVEAAENEWRLIMVRCYRRVVPDSIREWEQSTPGIGEHTLARLLGAIGHPVHTTPHWWEGEGDERVLMEGKPFDRRVSDLWSYCGYGDPNRKRRKGMPADQASALGNPDAKMLTRLIAEACLKAERHGSPYAKVYRERRAYTAEHRDWTDGHCHNDALRIAGKEMLKDLWKVSRTPGHSQCDTQATTADGSGYNPRSSHTPRDTQSSVAGPAQPGTHPDHWLGDTHSRNVGVGAK